MNRYHAQGSGAAGFGRVAGAVMPVGLWSLHLGIMYLVNSAGCGGAIDGARWIEAVITAVTIGLIAANVSPVLGYRETLAAGVDGRGRGARQFLEATTAVLSLFFGVAVAFNYIGIAWLAGCHP